VKVGDLVKVTGRPKDGWVPFLGIIVGIEGHQYKVKSCAPANYTFLLYKGDMEAIDGSE